MRLAAPGAAVLASALLAGPVAAQMTLTLYAGYVGSDGVDNVSTDSTARQSRARRRSRVALGTVLDPSRELQLIVQPAVDHAVAGRRCGTLRSDDPLPALRWHAFLDGPIERGWYVAGGLGATQFSPSTTGYGSEIKASLNLGVGYYWPLSDNVGLRAEARGFVTFVNSSGGFLCSGGCVVVLSSDIFLQYEAMLGLNARF